VLPFGQRTLSQIGIEFSQVLHRRDRRGPIPLQVIDAVFNVRLLIAPRRHAEARIETIVTGQRLVPRVKLTLASLQDRRRHRLGIVPPDLQRNTTEEGKPFNHPGQNRLGPLTRQRHGKAKARVTPRQNQDRDVLTSLGKVHVDVSEIGLHTTARRMRQGKERLTVVSTVLGDVTANLVIAAHVALFVPQTSIELGRRVTLFAWGLLILSQDLIDQRLVGPQTRRWPALPQRVRTRLTFPKHLANLLSGMPVAPGDLPNTHPVPMSDPDPAIVFHRQHPFSPSN
jgi:hypothetical protein